MFARYLIWIHQYNKSSLNGPVILYYFFSFAMFFAKVVNHAALICHSFAMLCYAMLMLASIRGCSALEYGAREVIMFTELWVHCGEGDKIAFQWYLR